MPGCEVVAAVQHHVGRRDLLEQVMADQSPLNRDHLDAWIGLQQGQSPRLGLGPTHSLVRVQDLALQVGEIDGVAVGQHDSSDARAGQIQRSR